MQGGAQAVDQGFAPLGEGSLHHLEKVVRVVHLLGGGPWCVAELRFSLLGGLNEAVRVKVLEQILLGFVLAV